MFGTFLVSFYNKARGGILAYWMCEFVEYTVTWRILFPEFVRFSQSRNLLLERNS